MPYRDGIFLSGLWRCGSTYIWSKFRALPDTYCFYEPLNQGLGRLNRKRIERYKPEVTKINTHPVMEKPYFAEFEPLMKRRGVRGFRRRFAYDRYALHPDEKDEALKKYTDLLCATARQQNKIPVLGYNQVMFRLAWLKNNFDAYTVHIDRHPREIWNSYKRLAGHENYTYFLIWLTIVERNAAHPLFAPLAEKFRLRGPLEKIFIKPKKFYLLALADISDENTYFMVFYLWCMTALQALSYSDQIIDINRAGEPGYNDSCARTINAATGLQVDFAEMRTEGGGSAPVDFDSIENEVLAMVPAKSHSDFFRLDAIRGRLDELAGEKAALLARLL